MASSVRADVLDPDRRIAPTAAELELLTGLGVIYPDGEQGATAFLIGSCDVLVTAKHTVLDESNRPRADRYVYYPGNGDVGIEALFVGSLFGRGHDFADDWIVMRLAAPDPGCRPMTIWAPSDDELIALSGRFTVAGFHADRDGALLISHDCGIERACQARSRGASEFTHTCDTYEGASGAPVYVERPDGIAVFGINIAGMAFEPADVCDRSNLARRMSDAFYDAVVEMIGRPREDAGWLRRRPDTD